MWCSNMSNITLKVWLIFLEDSLKNLGISTENTPSYFMTVPNVSENLTELLPME